MSDTPGDGDSQTEIWKLLVEIKTKLDNVLKASDDYEKRLRDIEVKIPHMVTVRTLWTGLIGAAGAATAVGQFVEWVLHR